MGGGMRRLCITKIDLKWYITLSDIIIPESKNMAVKVQYLRPCVKQGCMTSSFFCESISRHQIVATSRLFTTIKGQNLFEVQGHFFVLTHCHDRTGKNLGMKTTYFYVNLPSLFMNKNHENNANDLQSTSIGEHFLYHF